MSSDNVVLVESIVATDLYEYTIQLHSYPDGTWSGADRDIEKQGWKRIYADITLSGVCALYRRIKTC